MLKDFLNPLNIIKTFTFIIQIKLKIDSFKYYYNDCSNDLKIHYTKSICWKMILNVELNNSKSSNSMLDEIEDIIISIINHVSLLSRFQIFLEIDRIFQCKFILFHYLSL